MSRVVAGLCVLCCLIFAAAERAAAQERIGPRADYAGVAAALERFIDHEMRDKRLPAVSIALVDDQEIVWARGLRLRATRRTSVPATAETVYRVGSVSKLFTDLGVDAARRAGRARPRRAGRRATCPISGPRTRSTSRSRLRQLMAHRVGAGPRAARRQLLRSTRRRRWRDRREPEHDGAGLRAGHADEVLERRRSPSSAACSRAATAEPFARQSRRSACWSRWA